MQLKVGHCLEPGLEMSKEASAGSTASPRVALVEARDRASTAVHHPLGHPRVKLVLGPQANEYRPAGTRLNRLSLARRRRCLFFLLASS